MSFNPEKIESWRLFADGHLPASDRPTPAQAAAHVFDLMARVSKLERDLADANRRHKTACQRFDTLAIEIGNLATKARREVEL